MKQIDLLECRDKLDVIDREIVRLFEERMAICGDVAEYKIGTGKAVYDAERERQKIAAAQGLTRITARPMVVLPEPDSPTREKVSPL